MAAFSNSLCWLHKFKQKNFTLKKNAKELSSGQKVEAY